MLGKLAGTMSTPATPEVDLDENRDISNDEFNQGQQESAPEKPDVYTRLAGQYTKCSQTKRQKAINRSSLEKKQSGRSSLESVGSVSSRHNSGALDDFSDSEDVCNYDSQDDLNHEKSLSGKKGSTPVESNQSSVDTY